MEASTFASDFTETLSAVAGTTADVLGNLGKFAKLSGLLGGLGSGLGLASFWLGKSDTDITQTLIINSFKETNQLIEDLSEQIQTGFQDLMVTDFENNFDSEVQDALDTLKRNYISYTTSTTIAQRLENKEDLL